MKILKITLLGLVFLNIISSCSNNRKDVELVKSGKIFFSDEKYTEAIPYFSKAIKRNSTNDEAYAYRGLSYYKLENYSNAQIDFLSALKYNPDNETAIFGQACIMWNLEDYRKAFPGFNRLIQINPQHDKAYFYRGRAFLYYGDTIQALNDLHTALAKDSCFMDTYYLLSSVLTAQKKYDEADKYLELALKCKQNNSTN